MFNTINFCITIYLCFKYLSAQNKTNCFLTFPIISLGMTFKTLNLTVLDKGLVCPITTMSPSLTEKAGEMWTGMLVCFFSYLLYLFT